MDSAASPLALIDSTSVGTLVIPLWMMLAPRLRISRLLSYLAVVAMFYFAVGLALLAGLDALLPVLGDAMASRATMVVQLALGAGLVVVSYVVDPAYESIGRKRPAGQTELSPRASRWQSQLTGQDLSIRTVVGIAVATTSLEVATMLPYLAATGIISSSGEPTAIQVGLLVGYVFVMLLPALAALALRLLAKRHVEPLLSRFSHWLATKAGSAMAWTIGIVGAVLALNALGRLTSMA